MLSDRSTVTTLTADGLHLGCLAGSLAATPLGTASVWCQPFAAHIDLGDLDCGGTLGASCQVMGLGGPCEGPIRWRARSRWRWWGWVFSVGPIHAKRLQLVCT